MATDYRISHTARDIALTIGQRSKRLAALFATNGVDCGAFLTAYNPQGTIQTDAANDQAHAELAPKLRILSDIGLSWWSEWDAEQNEWESFRRLQTSYVEALSTRGLSYHSDDCDGDLVVRRFGDIPTSYLRRFNG